MPCPEANSVHLNTGGINALSLILQSSTLVEYLLCLRLVLRPTVYISTVMEWMLLSYADREHPITSLFCCWRCTAQHCSITLLTEYTLSQLLFCRYNAALLFSSADVQSTTLSLLYSAAVCVQLSTAQFLYWQSRPYHCFILLLTVYTVQFSTAPFLCWQGAPYHCSILLLTVFSQALLWSAANSRLLKDIAAVQ
jgi:hypothetical protein